MGGQGADSILGGSGDDIIYGGSLSSTLSGGSGNDSIFGGNGDDIIYGGTGDSTISAVPATTRSRAARAMMLSTAGLETTPFRAAAATSRSWAAWAMTRTGRRDATRSSEQWQRRARGGRLRFVADGFWLAELDGQRLDPHDHRRGLARVGLDDQRLPERASGGRHGELHARRLGLLGRSFLQGGTGTDTLIGARGPDTLVGGTGNDSLVGGGANDTFAFNSDSSGSQTIDEPQDGGVAGLDFSQAPAGISINLGESGPQAVMPATLGDGADPDPGRPARHRQRGRQLIRRHHPRQRNDNTLLGGGGQDLIAGLGGDDVLEGSVTRTVYLDFDTYELPGQHFYTDDEREAIQTQIKADYSAFSYVFTQTQPQSGPYTTIYFNDPVLVGLEGGIATEIDWRDLDISGTTSLTAAGLEVIPPDTGGVNVNNFLGGPGQPAASSDDFVGLSATIAAHELGHLSGLDHGDAFGPIGSGIYSGVEPDLYNPEYPGAIDATETVWHIMASGASVNSTVEDAINDPFFGERESIGLSFGENGSPTNEQITPHESMADAQPIMLAPLVVPDTDLEGVDADKSFDVTAADVVGYLGETNGASNTDFYSFTAPAGTVINFQLMSAALTRSVAPAGTAPNEYNQGPFDTYLAIFNSSGQVIDSNDDSFQDSDSSIIDLTLPYTGTYYAMVTSSPKSVSLERAADRRLRALHVHLRHRRRPARRRYDVWRLRQRHDHRRHGRRHDRRQAHRIRSSMARARRPFSRPGPLPGRLRRARPDRERGPDVTLTGSFIDPFETPRTITTGTWSHRAAR